MRLLSRKDRLLTLDGLDFFQPRGIFVLLLAAGCSPMVWAKQPDVQTIIQKSVEANQRDYKAAPYFNNQERDRDSKGTKTYQITMIEGTPYQRLTAVNGKSLSPSQAAQEMEKQKQVAAQRKAESPQQRQQRIEKYERDRRRDNEMMSQLTQAFVFKMVGVHKARGFNVWALKATPKPGYNPPSMDAKVLLGMQGELWIDQRSFQWVRVMAEVIRPVSIEGFLAQVEPGTRFELENVPVGNGVWQASHFAEKASAKVLFMFNHNSQQESWYYDYQPVTPNPGDASAK